VTSYGVLFDDEFAGRTALEAGWSMPFPKTAAYLAFNDLADITAEQIRTPDRETIDTVIGFLQEQQNEGQFRTFWSGWESAVNLLASEEVYAMDTWEPVVFALRNEGMNAYYLQPDEGYAIWSHGPWMTSAGVEKEGAVEELVSWFMDGFYGADVTSATGYLTATPRGIDYANESDDYDGDAVESVHNDVLENRLRHENSVFSDNFPSVEIFNYVSTEWNSLTT
jgi:putative spermidine/putrescine transport system substrate-binding protein